MLLSRKIKLLLERSSFYMRIRYGSFSYKIWLLIRGDVRKTYGLKYQLYTQIIPSDCSLIFDIGANEGMLTIIFSRLSKRVIAIEPASRNLSILKAKFYKNNNIKLLPVAVSNTTGTQAWYEDTNDYAMGTLSSKWNEIKSDVKENKPAVFIETITLDDIIQQQGQPDYIKIDVEGNELLVLQGLSQKIRLLSFEAILPHFHSETVQCIEQLCVIQPTALFNYCTDEAFAYPEFVTKEILIKDIATVNQTIDIFCRML